MTSRLRQTMHAWNGAGRFAAYQPQFHVEEFQPGRWWVLDGETQVGLVLRDQHVAELVNWDPCAPRPAVPFPNPYHAPSQPGERITLSKYIDGVGGTRSAHQSLRLEVQRDSVTVYFEEAWENGREATKSACFHVDPDFGYAVRCVDSMTFPGLERDDVHQEYCNFLPRGVTDDRPETGARYSHILWQHPDGRVLRWNQNNVSARALGAMDTLGERRVRTGGFIGFFGETDHDIALEINESNPGTTAITCPNMLDQHIMWLPVGQSESRYHAVTTLVAVPPAVSAALAVQAQPLDLLLDRPAPALESWNRERTGNYPQVPGTAHTFDFYPFVPGEVADFETPLDAHAPFRGQVFPYRTDTGEAITVVSDCAYSGMHSLRVRVNGETLAARPHGGSLHVTEGQRYRLSAWIKQALTDGVAALAGIEFQFSLDSVSAEHRAAAASAETGWQHVAVEFTPGSRAHALEVRFEVSGKGLAWIDDILLERIDG